LPARAASKTRSARSFSGTLSGTAAQRCRYLIAASHLTIGNVDPQVLVVGGAFSRSADLILEPLRVELEELAGEVPELRASSLGAESVALGGISLALDALDVRLLSGSRGALPELAAESL